ncbi:hypothetical protein L596_024456 [Steinernema carpocapsae]|uniref:Nucleolar protein 16 n=1 Tax=Steinernema carpocapsae TaxID=34508 RepID=A0A4U5MGS4_STECR|nr:hypothetical protein L596_024456 [Steinernema carpocapsae]
MPRSVKHGGKKKSAYRNLKNFRAKKLKSHKKKKEANTSCKAVADAWNKSETMKANLKNMGLSDDVNQLISLPKANLVTGETIDVEMMSLDEAKKIQKPTKVVSQIEKEQQSKTAKNSKRPEFKRLLPRDVEFCNNMIAAHGLDFEAMARDHNNLNQLTAKQIERRINTFKRSFRFQDTAE